MTESKKKTTEKEVDETNESAPKQAKKLKSRETIEKQEDESETEEVNSKTAEKTAEVEEVAEVKELEKGVGSVKVEDYQLGPEKKERKPKKETEAEPEFSIKGSTRNHATPQEFDWDAFESDEMRNSPKYKEYENLYDETLSTVAVDEVVIGTVIQMTSREVVINIGYKSEGVVSLNEFRYNPNLKVGDKVEVYVESQVDKDSRSRPQQGNKDNESRGPAFLQNMPQVLTYELLRNREDILHSVRDTHEHALAVQKIAAANDKEK